MSSAQPHGRVAPILASLGSLLLLAGVLWGVAAGQGLTRVVHNLEQFTIDDSF